jgi:hypothetical protein
MYINNYLSTKEVFLSDKEKLSDTFHGLADFILLLW